MRRSFIAASLASLLVFAAAAEYAKAAPSKAGTGSLVIVFKDGHRQAFNLTDIERVEFPASPGAVSQSAPLSPDVAPRGRFFGKWEVGDGNGSTFYITLHENGDAYRSLRGMHGKWVYVNGEAQITWNDGWMDAIRRVGSQFQKFAYSGGKKFTDTPDNVAEAHNTNPRPI